jgi:hypothetical protein
VVWAATNSLPDSVRIYKVVPSSFSPAAVSYLKSISGSISPNRGLMNFYKQSDLGTVLTNVPDKARAYELGTNLLTTLGVPFSELDSEPGRPRAWFSPGTRGRFDRVTRQRITEPCTMGVSFRRTIDGLQCNGQEVRFQFESMESLTQIHVCWHGLQSTKVCHVAAPDQIVAWIKDGYARAHAVETTGSRWIKVRDIKKVTVRYTVICYDATPDWRNDDKVPEYLYPFANLHTEVEFSSEDKEIVRISVPIVKEALSRPAQTDSEFNIYPSSLLEKLVRKPGAN